MTHWHVAIMETPFICPYCMDQVIDEIPGAELVAKNAPGERRISTARVFHCSLWHVFAVFPQVILQEPQTNHDAAI